MDTAHESADFVVSPSHLRILATVYRAVESTLRVHVHWIDADGEDHITKGVARSVVQPDSIGFAFIWTKECRLRVTATWEAFIPLGSIQNIVLDVPGAIVD